MEGRALRLVVIPSRMADLSEIDADKAETIAGVLRNWLCSHGLEDWYVGWEFE